ncbi:glycoside hydrolase family 3 N-terminal domain-containing protein [Homoserinibacter sp. GY 40078]|uniref:glycoside hydrolase family 3 N-terminal domain-containing protein n=1 Tax=Homoserinibacter sp. GY 40078 TaxID=2603275 RepID=UPI0011C8F344|nr:glycoside hydrolase family 3 N-terminal domain-containing protein [Homoserinibacter sp. GY 40078]TXK17140.1 glycoside hydrolase family 3 protein [Homoserinibacter sp. GY 40078]
MPRRTIGLLVTGALALALAACAQPAEVSTEPPHGWAAAAPAEPVDPVVEYAEARLADMSVRERAASVLLIHVPGTDPATLRDRVASSGVAGVILMGDNTADSVATTRALTAGLATDSGLPPLSAIDQEGGIVARLPDPGPSARALAGLPVDDTRTAFADRARLVADAGVDINFGIVADVTGDPTSFLAPRVFGGDTDAVSARVAAAVEGEQGIVLSTLKHFPGHGGAPGDSHRLIPQSAMSLAKWRTDEAPPFEAGIAAGAELVMMGHLRYTAVDDAPASLSPAWYGILRDELEFEGVAVTDDLSMLQASGESDLVDPVSNGVTALEAGADLLLYVGPIDTGAFAARVAQEVERGSLPLSRLDDAALRVLELRRAESASDAPYVRCRDVCALAAS